MDSVGGERPPLRVASLFAGAGGFELGFRLVGGYSVYFANDLKPEAASTFARNFFSEVEPLRIDGMSAVQLPAATYGDVSMFDFLRIGEVQPDVLTGGPPCQDFSVMKGQNREGTEVHRGRLYLHFVRAVAQLQPRGFVFENVPGLVSANGGRAFRTILKDFENPSYVLARLPPTEAGTGFQIRTDGASYRLLLAEVVDAQVLGVPQTRRRLIIVGLRQDEAERKGVFALESAREWLKYRMKGGGSLLRQFPLTCMEVFEGRPVSELQETYREVMEAYQSLPEEMPGHRPSQEWKRELDTRWTLNAEVDYLTVSGIPKHALRRYAREFDEAMEEHVSVLRQLGYYGKAVSDLQPADGTNRLPREVDSVLERMRRIPPGMNYDFMSGTEWEVEGKGLTLIYRRPFPLSPAPTVVAFGGGGTYAYHYARTRSMLTNRERARLQTFTDDFSFSGTQSEIRAQIGEAVPPLLAARIAEELLDVLS
jgi:DNA (cytosine-5)-methyltransferase 1